MSKLLDFIIFSILIITSSSALLKKTRSVQLPLNLGKASSFAILSRTGVTDVSPSSVVGNVGSYPITGAAILLTCPEVTGIVYQSDARGATCFTTAASYLLSAVSDMALAFTNANLLKLPDHIDLGAGDISGKTLLPGLYSWGTSLGINADVYISGTSTDVWIFTIAGDLDLANGIQIILQGGAKSSNIFWVVAGSSVDIGTTAVFQGSVLAKNKIALRTGATVYGRLLAQTAVTLQMSSVVIPTA